MMVQKRGWMPNKREHLKITRLGKLKLPKAMRSRDRTGKI